MWQNLPVNDARYLEAPIAEDLRSKMVFLAGPRQVGKTTLARNLLAAWPAGSYLSWDNRADRKEIRAARWPAESDGGAGALLVLDELHKWKGWKGWLKGEFDQHRDRVQFLVTGSARLDLYRRGSDSLQGRYHHYRLHPFSLAEAQSGQETEPPAPGAGLVIPRRGFPGTLSELLRLGGFPEPFLSQSERVHRRWQKERLERFFREDVRELAVVRELSQLELLADLLPERVGSPLSLNALREDLEVSHKAISHWVEILDRFYYLVRVPPFTSMKVRALRKMPKTYLWDWSLVAAPGPRFENLVALHLLKFCHWLEDREGHAVALHYLRDRDGHEVDFLVTYKRKPWFAVEVKLSATEPDPSLLYFRDRLAIPWVYQVTLEGQRDFVENGVRVLPAQRFLAALV